MTLINPAGGPSSSLVNDQLVATADGFAISPPGAMSPYMGLGAGPSNLPTASSPLGGAVGGAGDAMYNGSGNGNTTIASVGGDFRNLPFWQNPAVWWIVALIIGYAILRGVFWG